MKTDTLDNVKDSPAKAGREAAPAERTSPAGALGKPAEWWHRGRDFLADVRAETKRVTWPARREVYATTVVVILTSIFFGVYLWGVDMALNKLVAWVFRVGAGR